MASDGNIELLTPLLEGGIHNTNFFNGRLLSAEDMQREQAANRRQHEQLGQLMGEGVAWGLEVRKKEDPSLSGQPSRVVRVSRGMAVNRLGDSLNLAVDIDLHLVREKEAVAESAGLFASCERFESAEFGVGSGIYILVISPASGYEGMAPASGIIGDLAARGGCRRRDTVEGVQFRLVKVWLTDLKGISAETIRQIGLLEGDIFAGTDREQKLSMLRNTLAHLCFGSEAFAAASFKGSIGSFGAAASFSGYRLVDKLRSLEKPVLTECDVPLALVYWTRQGLAFVDNWSVRRKPVPGAVPGDCSSLAKNRRADAEASFFQFQEQLSEITGAAKSQAELNRIDARKWFRYLPPAGVVSVNTGYVNRYMQNSGASFFTCKTQSAGLEPDVFFEAFAPHGPVFIDTPAFAPLLHDSFLHAPLDLQTGEKELIWLYLLRENVAALRENNPPGSYLVFATRQMEYRGSARVNSGRWGYSNYAD